MSTTSSTCLRSASSSWPGFQEFLNYERPQIDSMTIITLRASAADRDASGPQSPFFQQIVSRLVPLLLAEIQEGATSVGTITVLETPDKLDSVRETLEHEMLADEQQHSSFKGCLKLTDRSQGRVMVVTLLRAISPQVKTRLLHSLLRNSLVSFYPLARRPGKRSHSGSPLPAPIICRTCSSHGRSSTPVLLLSRSRSLQRACRHPRPGDVE